VGFKTIRFDVQESKVEMVNDDKNYIDDAVTTSFFPPKPLRCYGDGGEIFTNEDDLAKFVNAFKVHGKGDSKYDNVRIGVNSRLDSI
jgi:dTDP-4-amino-4,6-dideoxygalactose transaminase